jgi:hypothetical protein
MNSIPATETPTCSPTRARSQARVSRSPQPSRFGRFGRKATIVLASAAVAFAAVGVGSASAGVTKTGAAASIAKAPINTGPIKVQPIQQYTAPTANLTKLANAFVQKQKSVTSLITAPAGLNLTKPVTISVSYEGGGTTNVSYVNSSGNHFLHNFASNNGVAAYRGISVNLDEQVSATQHQLFRIQYLPLVQPLYDVRVSNLAFHLNNDCDWIGDSEPVVQWKDPAGHYGEADFSLGGGDNRTITGFAHTYYEVGQLNQLHTPYVQWWEDDGILSVGAVIPNVTTPNLVFGPSYTVSRNFSELSGQSCSAKLTYSVSKTLRWYPYL